MSQEIYRILSGEVFDVEVSNLILSKLENGEMALDHNLFLHSLIFCCYRRFDVCEKNTKYNKRVDKIMERKDEVILSLHFVNQARWKISFFSFNLYSYCLHLMQDEIKLGKEQVKISFDYLMEGFNISLQNSVIYPSCFVGVSRAGVILSYFYYLVKEDQKARDVIADTWESFRRSMNEYVFNIDISKADEIRHISDSLLLLQYLAMKLDMLKDGRSNRKPPSLPSHSKHKPFSNSILKLSSIFKGEREIWH